MISKFLTMQISTIIALTIAGYIAYYFLLQDNFLHISISSIMQFSHHLAIRSHLLVLGLLPIYIATMIFGAAMGGIYLGSTLQNILVRTVKK